MSLTTSEIGLLRDVFTWTRANGVRETEIERGECARCRVWANADRSHEVHLWDRLESTDDLGVFVKRNNFTQGLELRDVREIVDVLCALGVLPPKFSSAFAAGRESAYDRDEWRVMVSDPAGPAIWCRSFSEAIGRLDVALAARDGSDVWLEHRRAGEGPWVRVPEAGGPDAHHV